MYVLEVWREGEWHIVGQYTYESQARAVAQDYSSRGERTRIVKE